ncbi:MAG TPA: hypothetical protein VGB70_06005 [Allosphingosinicella sp.]|jgi:hypothetical protein
MPLIIVSGATGQHGSVVYEAAALAGLPFAGFVTLGEGPPPLIPGAPFLGTFEGLLSGPLTPDAAFTLAMGDNAQRRAVAERLKERGARI